MGQTESLQDDHVVDEDLGKVEMDLPLKIDYFIPDDIFFSIFTFLGFGDMGRVKLCNKRFYYLAHLARNSFKFNGISAADPKVIKEIVEILSKEDVCNRYRTIDLGLLHLEAVDLNLVTEKCRNLRKLYLKKCMKIDDEALDVIVKNCSQNLRELDLVGVQNITRKGLKTLSTLKLEFFGISSFKRTETLIPVEMISDRYEGTDQPECCKPNYFFYEFFAHGNQGKDLKRLCIDSSPRNITHVSNLYNLIVCAEEDLFKGFPRGNYEKLESLELHGYMNQNEDSSHLRLLFPKLKRFELWKVQKDYMRYDNPKIDLENLLLQVNENIELLRTPELGLSQVGGSENAGLLKKFTELKSLRIDGEAGRGGTETPFSFLAIRGCSKTLRYLEVTTMYCEFQAEQHQRHISPISEFESLEKLIFSFRRLNLIDFNLYVVPYLVKQGPKLRHLEIQLPQTYPRSRPWDFSFLGTLKNCSILGLKGLPEKRGAERAVNVLLESEILGKMLKSIDFSGMVGARKWMVEKIFHRFYGTALEELVMFGVDGPLEFHEFNDLRKKCSIRLYVTKK